MKTCTHCGAAKLYSEFWKHPGTLDGRQSWCKSCMKAAGPARTARSRWRRRPGIVQVRTEDELRMALKDPYPFYAEPRR